MGRRQEAGDAGARSGISGPQSVEITVLFNTQDDNENEGPLVDNNWNTSTPHPRCVDMKSWDRWGQTPIKNTFHYGTF